MAIFKVVNIVFLCFYISSFSFNNEDQNSTFLKDKKLIDSLTIDHNQNAVNEEKAQEIINTYGKNDSDYRILTDKDLKILAINYGHLEDVKNASIYIEKYIKSSHDIEILNNSSFDNMRQEKTFLAVNDKFGFKFNFWFVFYSYVALIGVFLAFVLNLKKSSDWVANLLISLFILLGSLFILHVCIFITNVMFRVPHTAFFTVTFNFLYGPLLYFYFKRTTESYKFKRKDILHLIPFAFFLIYFSKYYILSGDEKLHIMLNREETFDPILNYLVALKVISLLTYGILIYKLCTKDIEEKMKDRIIHKWKHNIAILNLAYVFSHIFYVTIIILFASVNFLIHPQLISMSIFILFVGYTAYVQPDVFNKNYPNYTGGLFFNKYKKSGLTEGLSFELKEQLLKLFDEEKIYKINNINLEMLSDRLETNRHSASQVINEHFNMNFFNLINKYRIQEAIEIFKNDKNHTLNIIDVAYDVGYNNKVTFNKAFKDVTGLTPSKFINNMNKNAVRTLKINLE